MSNPIAESSSPIAIYSVTLSPLTIASGTTATIINTNPLLQLNIYLSETMNSDSLMIDMEEILRKLSKERPVFHSERDFQHALAWKIHEQYPDMNVRLEKRIELDGKEIYVDIYLQDKEMKEP